MPGVQFKWAPTKGIDMIDREGLEAAGYRNFPQAIHPKADGCECLWQKKVEDGSGTRYYINIYEWRIDRVVPSYRGPSPTFQPSVQFTRGEGGRDTVDVNFYCGKEHTLGDIEAFYDEAWTTMGFSHHEKNSWDAAPSEAQSGTVPA